MLEWFKKLVPLMPETVFAWDNAGNNKSLVSGQSALIMNPPSAWAVAERDAPKVAEQLWTFPSPKGPKGRFDPTNFGFWGIWKFSKNNPAAKSLLTHLSTRQSVQTLVEAARAMTSRLSRNCTISRPGPKRATQGHDLQLPAAQRRDRRTFGLSGPGQYRIADLCAGDDVQNGRQMHPRRQIGRCGDRLRRLGTGRLYALVKAAAVLRAGAPRGAVNSAGF